MTKRAKSLKYLIPELYYLSKPHYMWSLAASNTYESTKSTILAKMASGRYHTEWLPRYWSNNRSGCCRAPSCISTPGTQTRERLFQMWQEHTVMFPSLHATIRVVIESTEDVLAQFVLEPLAFPDIYSDFKSHGIQFAHLPSYFFI